MTSVFCSVILDFCYFYFFKKNLKKEFNIVTVLIFAITFLGMAIFSALALTFLVK